MKKYLLFFLLIGFIGGLTAQDIIVFRTGDEVEAIVKKVGITSVEYIRYDNKEGAVYEVLKEDVFMIKYENGIKDVFEASIAVAEPIKRIEGTFINSNSFGNS